ncbi:MAG: hypothetical protein QXR73_02890 [Candidatus Micrarchaeaceae archaeon]
MQILMDKGAAVFTIEDAVKILRAERGYASLFLRRSVGKGTLGVVERGMYYIKGRANEYEIASNVVRPSYVSMVSALAYYGLTTQSPIYVYVVSTKRHKPLRGIEGFDIIFKNIKEGMMFGYHKEANGSIFMADPEKAIVDILYFNDVNDLDEDVLMKPPRIDVAKLLRYAKQSNSNRVITNVEELLGRYSYNAHAENKPQKVKKEI